MSSLIQVPRDKEQIKEFLADGQTRGIPFVQASDLNDGDLLAATSTIDLGGGSYKFSINLPSGRNLESAPVGPDYPKRDATFQWLDAVRSAVVGDAEQAAEEAYSAARQREPIDVPTTGAVNSEFAGNVARANPSDPVEYAKQQLRAALERLEALGMAEADVERWQKVVSALTGDVPKGTKRKKRRKKAPVKGL